ncbi:MAG: sarcosine oxidase subunit alpha family protein [Hyphomicrobiaceae bacterium]|nr:sarcosine oxidase subunit alpha family protein [Hyphomicrobiaceae bacterium]
MSGQSHRLPSGGRIDRSKTVRFSFDGRSYEGHPGDTLASGLIANGVHLTGRSFKYHRPRGITTSGSEEPNALVTTGEGGRTEPNVPATMVELHDGLVARSQNRWPSLSFDLMAVNSLLKPFFPAGFYYKTFMWPRSFWYRLYEPAIRRAAGLGTIADQPDPDVYEHSYAHCDVLVVGAGPAGLMAAQAAARAGARVVLADERAVPGGHLAGEAIEVDGRDSAAWAQGICDELDGLENVQMLLRTSVFGRYDGLTFGAVERVGDHLGNDSSGDLRQRRWTIQTRQFVCATGAIERPLVFGDNDRPGIMLAGSARHYVNQYGVLPGRKVVVATNNDDSYLTARDLARAGADVTLIDSRREKDVTGHALLPGETEVRYGQCVTQTCGKLHVSSARLADISEPDHIRSELPCDLICTSGGWNPTIHLLSHCGARPKWDSAISAFAMAKVENGVHMVGGAAGTFELQKCLQEGVAAGVAAASACSRKARKPAAPKTEKLPEYRIQPLWRLPDTISKASASFVDFQNDVTIADLELADREGFGHAEHAKRYTTLGMATDQGKLSNVNAIGVLSELRGTPIAETGTTTYRPLYTPAALGTLAGQRQGAEFRATRHSAMHQWHEKNGAVFTEAGLWLRPYYYPREGEDFAAAVKREVLNARSAVGMVDVSTLGKIELKGPDSGQFLDRLYINSFSKMKTGRARYGVMLREDGMVFDDGTVTRLADDHYFITVTTANASGVMQHMEFCHQVHWPDLDVQFCSVTEVWAAMAVAGPKARDVLSRVVDGIDLSNEAFPLQSVADARIGDAFVRVLRISFSGELAYEIYTPADCGLGVWEAIMEAGAEDGISAYGTEAMTVMRTEKGHVAGPELDGRTTADDLGLGRMMSQRKDYIGRWLSQRSGLTGAGRSQLVGLKPITNSDTFRMGAHLVTEPGTIGPDVSQGHVTTSVYSPACDHFIGLALLQDGRSRTGERVYVASPLHNEQVEAEVTGPVFVDPDGERMRG